MFPLNLLSLISLNRNLSSNLNSFSRFKGSMIVSSLENVSNHQMNSLSGCLDFAKLAQASQANFEVSSIFKESSYANFTSFPLVRSFSPVRSIPKAVSLEDCSANCVLFSNSVSFINRLVLSFSAGVLTFLAKTLNIIFNSFSKFPSYLL